MATPRLLGTLSVISAASLIADAFAPVLLAHAPLVLLVASPRGMYVLALTNQLPLLLVVPLVTLRLCLTDPVHFELGRRVPVGPKSHGVVGRVGRQLRRFVDAVPGFGFVLAAAAWPVSHTLLMAGAGGARRRHIAIADIAGTFARVAVMCFVLARVEEIVSAANVVARVGPLAAVSFVTYTTIAVIARRRTQRQSDAWDDVAQQVESLRLEDRLFEVYGLSWPEPVPATAPRPSASSAAAAA